MGNKFHNLMFLMSTFLFQNLCTNKYKGHKFRAYLAAYFFWFTFLFKLNVRGRNLQFFRCYFFNKFVFIIRWWTLFIFIFQINWIHFIHTIHKLYKNKYIRKYKFKLLSYLIFVHSDNVWVEMREISHDCKIKIP